MKDVFVFVVNYLVVFLALNGVLLYYCILQNREGEYYLAYSLFFYTIFKDTFYRLWNLLLLQSIVVIDECGGEKQYDSRNIMIIVCVTSDDSIENFKNTLSTLLEEKFIGNRKIFIVNETTYDITVISNRIMPLYEIVVNQQTVMVCSGYFKGNEILFCHYVNENETLKNHLVVKKLVEYETSGISSFKPDQVLVVGCAEGFSKNFLKRMSNIAIANPRIAAVCGVDIELNGSELYSKIIHSKMSNKFGKYPHLSDTRLVLFNCNHPSIVKNKLSYEFSTTILSHSLRTWVVVDNGSRRINHVYNYKMELVRYLEWLIYSKNTFLSFVAILEIIGVITSLVRVLIFIFYVIANDIITFPKEEELLWVAVSCLIFNCVAFVYEMRHNVIVSVWTWFYQIVETVFYVPIIVFLLVDKMLSVKRLPDVNDK